MRPTTRRAGLAQNSAPEPTAARGRPFLKGTSGNPGGRPKAVRELLDRARASVPKALEFAESLLDNEDADARVRLDAAKFLAAYGLGAPPRVPDFDAPPDHSDALKDLTLEQMLALARRPLPKTDATEDD